MLDFRTFLQNQALPGITRLTKALDQFTPAFKEFRAYYAAQVDSVFERNAHGGTFRNLFWAPFPRAALPHTRMRAGLRWYGVNGGLARYKKPKRTDAPMTLGRRRPSGKRLTLQSKLMQDTGSLRKDASESILGENSLLFHSALPYAERQFGMRSPYSFTLNDAAVLIEITTKHLTRALLGGRRG